MSRKIVLLSETQAVQPIYQMRPSDCAMAPDRYGSALDLAFRWDETNVKGLRAFREACPYKAGDVIWCERYGVKGHYATRALILAVYYERDRDGDRLERYRVAYATQQNKWATVFCDTWPGYIERGYKRAAAMQLAN